MERQKVLIVDDEIDNVVLLEKRLKATGFDTITARDGDEAIDQTFRYLPDIVLLDIMMPRKDGYEVLALLRADDRTREIPVILLTAKAEVPDKVRGLEMGAVDYVTKPFDFKELLARITTKLDMKRQTDEQKRAEKMDALSTMIGGVAHEMRNPLVVIGGFAKKLMAMTDAGDPRYTFLSAIEKEVARLERMVRDIYEFKTIRISKSGTHSINSCITDALASRDAPMREAGVTVFVDLDPQDHAIEMDRDNFTAAIGHVLDNSIEAMRQGGSLSVSTRHAGSSYSIVITDTGRGIDEEDLRFVFDPFFTSKMEGAGLGLPVAMRVMQDHDGDIVVKSQKDVGTTVTITLTLTGTAP